MLHRETPNGDSKQYLMNIFRLITGHTILSSKWKIVIEILNKIFELLGNLCNIIKIIKLIKQQRWTYYNS